MDGEKHLQDLPERDDGWVEANLDDFGMPGNAGADLFVAGIGAMPAAIPWGNPIHAPNLFINGLQTPEATSPQNGDFHTTLPSIGGLRS
jgi:hypothetical protein